MLCPDPAGLGGLRVLPHLRQSLTNLKVLAIPDQIGFGSAHKPFDENDCLIDSKKAES